MVSAIQSVPSIYKAGQIISLATISQPAGQAKSLLLLPSAIVRLGGTTASQVTYNVFGLLDTASSTVNQASNDSTSSFAINATPDASTNELATKLALALEASSTTANSVILDEALSDSLAKQIAIGLNTSSAAQALATLSSTDANAMEAAANSTRALDSLLSSETSLTLIGNLATSNKEDVANDVVPALTTLTQSASNLVMKASDTVAATTTNVVVASDTTSPANTANTSNTAEVVNMLISSSQIDSGVQAVATVTQNPAYANMVAGNYVSLAASSAQSPSVITTPIKLEEIKPAIAISAISALSPLGAQSGRDGNPPSGYRQRRVNSIYLQDRY